MITETFVLRLFFTDLLLLFFAFLVSALSARFENAPIWIVDAVTVALVFLILALPVIGIMLVWTA